MNKVVNKVKDFVKNKKGLVIKIGIGVIALIIIIIALVLLLGKTNEKKLEKSLKEMGQDFYESFYYEATGKTDKERAEFVSKYEKIGVKIDLDNLGRYNGAKNKEKVSEFINSKTKKECDKNSTRAIIYPKKPFGKKDYTIEVELDCGFEK